MAEVMIDIETASTSPNAAILTVGAVKFDRTKPLASPCESLYVRIDYNDAILKYSLDVDEKTLDWWREQSKEVREEAFGDDGSIARVKLEEGLSALSDFVKDCKCVWANSPTFDCVILENAYKAANLAVPWKFWQLRDTRTVYDIAGVFLKDFTGVTKHNALSDAVNQVKALHAAFSV